MNPTPCQCCQVDTPADSDRRVVSHPYPPTGDIGVDMTMVSPTPSPCQTSDTDNDTRKQNRNLTQQDRFFILHRDKFTCRYCGAKPGGENLEVDHLVPVSFGGSDNPVNLVASCKTCNRRRSDQPLFPNDMILGTDDDGWNIVARFGVWTLKACRRGVVVSGAVYGKQDPLLSGCEYWFDINRAHEPDWPAHISEKGWGKLHTYGDFIQCLALAMQMTQ